MDYSACKDKIANWPAEKKAAAGSRRRGLTYERRVGRALAPFAESVGALFYDHPWLPIAGTWCQPDFLLVFPSGAILLIEAKLTQCDCSEQIAKYKKALSPHPVTALQVCRRILDPPTVASFEDAIDGGVMLLWQ